MHSKWQIWDFFSSVQKDFLSECQGVIALNTFDPICLKLAKDYLTRGMGNRVLHYKMAAEVSKGWIEEEFQTLSFFGGQDNFFIHQAQDLPADVLELILKLELQGRFILLSFETDNAAWKKILKDARVETLQVEAPKFWEPNKLLDFVCTYLRLPLSYESKSWMLEAMENNLPTFYNSASLLKLNYPEAAEVNLAQVKELLTLEKLDQFALASLYARRKPREFFERLIPLLGDFDRMRGFFNFLQSHLIKMMDPSYLSQKPRLTQYDKDLQNTSKLWKPQELAREVERFNRWELMCKKKESLLWHELKEASFV
jgi:hypothetical protein